MSSLKNAMAIRRRLANERAANKAQTESLDVVALATEFATQRAAGPVSSELVKNLKRAARITAAVETKGFNKDILRERSTPEEFDRFPSERSAMSAARSEAAREMLGRITEKATGERITSFRTISAHQNALNRIGQATLAWLSQPAPNSEDDTEL